MKTSELIKEVKQLPITKRFYFVEEILKSIKHDEIKNQLEVAADKLIDDYQNDNELTVFTALDIENFYETK